MSIQEKLILKFFQNPISLKYPEIEKILLTYGFTKKQGKGSHQKFKHPDLPFQLIFPVHNNDCKDVYKKFALKILKDHFSD